MIFIPSKVFEDIDELDRGELCIPECMRILGMAIYFMLYDIITKSYQIEFPSIGKSGMAYLCMRAIRGEEFKKRFREGEYRDVDYIMSDYTAYNFALKDDERELYFDLETDKDLKELILEKTNEGRRYF